MRHGWLGQYRSGEVLRIALRYGLEFGLIMPLGGTAVLCLRTAWPYSPGYLGIVLFVFLVWRIHSLINYHFLVKLSDFGRLRQLVDGSLFSDSTVAQRRAVGCLSLVLGRRFGSVGISRSRRVRCVANWRRWWRAHCDGLVWDPLLRVYVHDSSASQESASG